MRKKPAENRTRRRSEWVDRRREGGCRDKGGELPVLAPESEHVRVVGARLHRLEALERRHRVPEQQPENPGRGIRVRTRTRAPSEAKKKKMQRGIPWAVRGGGLTAGSWRGAPPASSPVRGMRGRSWVALAAAPCRGGSGVEMEEGADAGKEAVALAWGRRRRRGGRDERLEARRSAVAESERRRGGGDLVGLHPTPSWLRDGPRRRYIRSRLLLGRVFDLALRHVSMIGGARGCSGARSGGAFTLLPSRRAAGGRRFRPGRNDQVTVCNSRRCTWFRSNQSAATRAGREARPPSVCLLLQ
jgi:hypothetical protein